MDVLSSDDDSIIEVVENKIRVKKLYLKIEKCLVGREKIVIKMRYGLEDGKIKTQREIAKMMNISRSYVSRIEKRALKKLYDELGNLNKIE